MNDQFSYTSNNQSEYKIKSNLRTKDWAPEQIIQNCPIFYEN